MQKNTITADQLKEISGKDFLAQLNENNLSFLRSIGAGELLDEMDATGAVCRGLIDTICLEPDDRRLRRLACDLLKPTAPAKLLHEFPQRDHCIVMGFNHPSLGEIFRLTYLAFEAYPDREFLFPVNIPWYETLTPDIPKLARLGVSIVPMITPKTEGKLKDRFADNPEKLALVQKYKTVFEKNYMRTAQDMAKRNAIILLAPSATRQATVFPDEAAARGEGHIHPTMTLLAHRVLKDPEAKATFLPVVVFEPRFNNRKLNLFKRYRICPCESFETEEIRSLTGRHSRDFDYLFLKRLDDVYSRRKK